MKKIQEQTIPMPSEPQSAPSVKRRPRIPRERIRLFSTRLEHRTNVCESEQMK